MGVGAVGGGAIGGGAVGCGAIGGGAIGGGVVGGGAIGGGAIGGGVVGIGAVGSGKIGCCDGFGGFNFGNGGDCCSLLVAPVTDTWSRAGSLTNGVECFERFVSGCGEWVVIYLGLAFMDNYLSDSLNLNVSCQ